jgi:zinc protease
MSKKNHQITLLILILLYSIMGDSMATSKNKPKNINFIKKSNGVDEYKLDNGLKVLLKQDLNAPLISFQVWYRVGSRDEIGNETGMAHYLEHMMFKGTKEFRKGEIAQAIQLKGGVFNAFTSYDYTGYYENFAPENLELAIKIESDRMRNSRLDQEEIDLERSVIVSELEGGENYPSTILGKQLRATAFQKHSYHNPIIGWRSDLDNIKEANMRAFYNKYYAPNNAFIMLAGNFDKDLALDLIHRYFASYKKAENIHHEVAIEPEQKELRKSYIYYEGQVALLGMAFHIPEFIHPDLPALNIIDEILFNGTSSRLTKKLVDTGLAIDVHGYAESNKDPALYKIVANLNPEANIEKIEAVINAELEDIKVNVTKEEMELAKARVESSAIYQRDGVYDEALQIAYFEAIAGDWENYYHWYESLKKVSVTDVKKVAQKYFVPRNKTVVYKLPKDPGNSLVATAPKAKKFKTDDKEFYGSAVVEPLDSSKLERLLKITAPKYSKDKIKSIFNFALKPVHIDKYPSLKVVLKEDHNIPLVYIKASTFAGSALDFEKPCLAYLTANMLERGSKHRDKFTIAKALDTYGADIEFEPGKETSAVEISSLKKNLPKVMAIFKEIITEPLFSKVELEKLKKELIETIKQQDEFPSSVARSEMYRLIYPKGHIFYAHSSEEKIKSIQAISLADIKNFYQKYYGLDQMKIALVGDIDATEVKSLIESNFSPWQKKNKAVISSSPSSKLQAPKTKHIKKVHKKQSEVYMGHVGFITRKDPDFYPLFIANYALGGSPLSSRLGSKVRDEHGLVYNVGSTFQAGLVPGPFYITLGSNPNNVDKAIELTREAVQEFLRTGISETELKATKSFLTGSFAVRNLSSNEDVTDVASQMLLYDLDLDYPQNYAEIINSISLEKVNEAARKYIHPDKFNVVVVGP